MNSVKLQKYFSDCSVMSRRAAEEEIQKGRVTVNGEVATLGLRINPEQDVIIYNGKRILPSHDKKVYIMLNKPAGVLTTLSDEKGRKTVVSLLGGLNKRVYPVGRLDMYSDGLLLLTDDGELTYRLTHPRHEIPKIYHVTVEGEPTDAQLTILRSPLTIDEYKIQPVKAEIIEQKNGVTTLKMTLFEGRNRQIRKMCEIAKLKIRRLSRVALGKITIGSLKSGSWRYLSKEEIEYLKKESAEK